MDAKGSRRLAQVGAVALVCAAVLLGAAGAARADEAHQLIERCAHGQPLVGFSPAAYAKALRELPTVLLEYSNCEELIRSAALVASANRYGGVPPGSAGAYRGALQSAAEATALALGPGGGALGLQPPLAPTPEAQAALDRATRAKPKALALAGVLLTPGDAGLPSNLRAGEVPDVLWAALGATALLGGFSVLGLRRRKGGSNR